jgi:hypothetical protein
MRKASNGLVGKFKGHIGRPMCSNEDNIKKCSKELGCEDALMTESMSSQLLTIWEVVMSINTPIACN